MKTMLKLLLSPFVVTWKAIAGFFKARAVIRAGRKTYPVKVVGSHDTAARFHQVMGTDCDCPPRPDAMHR